MVDIMAPLNQSDKDKVNGLFLTLAHAKLNIPVFENETANQIAIEVQEGLEIIKQGVKTAALKINNDGKDTLQKT